MTTLKKVIGHAAVDSGLIWIGDPCYVIPNDGRAAEYVSDWSKFCETIQGGTSYSFPFKMGREGLGVCVSTAYGDGFYPVTATIKAGRVTSVGIDFE